MMKKLACNWTTVHQWATWLWIVVGLPVTYVLIDKPKWMALWIATISVYSAAVGHMGAWQASRAEDEAKKAADEQP